MNIKVCQDLAQDQNHLDHIREVLDRAQEVDHIHRHDRLVDLRPARLIHLVHRRLLHQGREVDRLYQEVDEEVVHIQ